MDKKLDLIVKVNNLYRKAINYLEEDLYIAYVLSGDILKILKKDIFNDSEFNISNSNKVLPQDIILAMKNLENILTDIFSYSEEDFKNLRNSLELNLKLVFSWYIESYNKIDNYKIEIDKYYKDNLNSLKIYTMQELFNIGWTFEKYMKEASKLNYDTIDDLTPEYNGDNEGFQKVVSETSENRKILLDENDNMVGLWSFIQLSDKWFKKAKKGELYDGEIRTTMVPPLIYGTYNLYFLTICHKVEYNRLNAFRKLYFSLIKTIEDFAIEGVFFNEICTLAYSESGKSLAKSIGLKYHTNHVDHGEIYIGKMKELLNTPICNEFNLIRSLYNKNI